MTTWCVTTSAENLAATAARGWTVQGLKSRRRPTAERLTPGDHLLYYVTKEMTFGGIVEVRSHMFEDHEVIWTSKPGEDYPWRVEIAPEVTPEPEDRVPVEAIVADLAFPSRWPEGQWRLAFQGNIREWPDEDLQVVRRALESAVAGT